MAKPLMPNETFWEIEDDVFINISHIARVDINPNNGFSMVHLTDGYTYQVEVDVLTVMNFLDTCGYSVVTMEGVL